MARVIGLRRLRGCLSAASSVLALGVAATSVPAGQAWAGDVDVSTPQTVVYGNSDPGDPATLLTSVSSSGNTVRLATGANITQSAYGGYADATTADDVANSNGLTVSGGTVGQNAYGGYSDQGDASSNTVTISGASTITGEVNGGRAASATTGKAENNTVTIEGSAHTSNNIYGGRSTSSLAGGNAVSIGENAVIRSDVYGGQSQYGTAAQNSVTIGGSADVRGSSLYGGSSKLGATDNDVTITGGSLDVEYVGGGNSQTGSASANSLTISGGNFVRTGAYLFGGGSKLDATGNTVDISGGTFASLFIAGGITQEASATGNTVTISGPTTFSNNAMRLYGGYCAALCAGDMFSGNTLNLKTAGLTVGTLANFEYLNFYLPTTLAANDTMLTVAGFAYLKSDSGASSIVNVGINGASSALAVGDSVKLIHAGTLTTAAGLNGTATGTGMQGVTLQYVFDISATTTDLIATVSSAPTVTDESKALSEGFVSGASLVNEGADLAAGKGMANAIGGARADWSPFAAVSGGSIRTNTGSHVDVDGVSLVAGLSRGVDLSIGRLTAGAFAEFGSGNYDTFNGFASGDVRGHGNSHYVGGGLLGHQDFRPMGPGHVYAEGSARIGVANNNYSSADLTSGGVAAGYETSSLYYGVSAAVGYVWTLSDAMTVDVSGKYLWSRLGSDSAQLTTGETVDFEAVNSERTRLGARVSYALSNKVTPYAGAAWEHEFDGKARASTNGFAIDAPSMAGDTGIFEAGLTLKPSDDLPLSIDLGIQGFVGQREGIAGSFQAKLAF